MRAAENGRAWRSKRALLDAGAEVNHANQYGSTALYCQCRRRAVRGAARCPGVAECVFIRSRRARGFVHLMRICTFAAEVYLNRREIIPRGWASFETYCASLRSAPGGEFGGGRAVRGDGPDDVRVRRGGKAAGAAVPARRHHWPRHHPSHAAVLVRRPKPQGRRVKSVSQPLGACGVGH